MRAKLGIAAVLVLLVIGLGACATATPLVSPVSPIYPTLVAIHSTAEPSVFLPSAYRCGCVCEPTSTPPPTATLEVEIYDCAGQVATTWWLTSTFGEVMWSPGSLAELRCSIGPAVLVAHVEDRDGAPLENATVILHWPDAPMLPLEVRSCGLDRGVYGPTNQNGDIGFGLGGGSYYFPPAGGPHVMWVAGGKSCLIGLGMLGGTDHQHLDSGWILNGALVEHLGADWGYSRGAVVYELTLDGRRMWVIRVP